MMTVGIVLFALMCWVLYSVLVEYFADKDGLQYLLVNLVNCVFKAVFHAIRDTYRSLKAWTELWGD